MTDVKKKDFSLTAEQLGRLSSPYIPNGIRQDVWSIDSVNIRNDLVQAKVSLGSIYQSPTDGGGAHLTMFATNEIVAQLMVIYMHVQAGFEQKCREVWAAELHGRYVAPIRELAGIDFVMQCARTRSVGNKRYCKASFTISAKCGGRFEVDVTGVMD